MNKSVKMINNKYKYYKIWIFILCMINISDFTEWMY